MISQVKVCQRWKFRKKVKLKFPNYYANNNFEILIKRVYFYFILLSSNGSITCAGDSSCPELLSMDTTSQPWSSGVCSPDAEPGPSSIIPAYSCSWPFTFDLGLKNTNSKLTITLDIIY